MKRRTLTMDWDGLGEDDDDERFFESYERRSSAVSLDLGSSGSDENEDFEDSRMSFASAISSASFKSTHPFESIAKSPCSLGDYDMWMAEPGDIKERRKRLLQGMGLSSNKDLLRLASSKVVKTSNKISKVDSLPREEPKRVEPLPSPPIVYVRSRSDGDIDSFAARTKQRKEELIGPISKQRLTRTSSGQLVPRLGVCQYSGAVTISQKRAEKRSPMPNKDVLQSVMSDGAFGSFFLIKNLDTGKEFIVKEYNDEGMWKKLSDVQTGKQLSMEEFEKSVGYSPVVKELMRRENVSRNIHEDNRKLHQNSYFSKSFRNSKRKGAALLKNIKGVATSMSGLVADKEQEHHSPLAHKTTKNTSQWVKARQHGKSYKEFTALHASQEIQAHEGSIWTLRFSWDARYLASAGEDKIIHVWEVQEFDVMSTLPADDLSSVFAAPVHPVACSFSDRPPLAEITPTPSERKKRKNQKKKGNSIPDYVNVPETVFALSEKPVCTFRGHQEDVLDLSWSRSQLLLSSSMDKTVRLWDLETKSCLKMFAHNDYVTCIQFNPVDDDYFISGSLDAKVRIWSIPDRHVVDWVDIHEMVTAACYTPDGQGAAIGSHRGSCRMYKIDDCKLEQCMDIKIKKKSQAKIIPGFQSQTKKVTGLQAQKITGLQFAPSNPSEVLITSANSRIYIYNKSELVHKFRGFRNTSSQISGSFSADGKYVISASEDSQVYVWKVEETKNVGTGKGKSRTTIQSHEHFPCKDVSVAIQWPGSTRIEAPIVELHSKRHSKRLSAPSAKSSNDSPTGEDNLFGGSSRRLLPPIPKKSNDLERTTSCVDEYFAHSARTDPGIGISESFDSYSRTISEGASLSNCASGSSPPQSWSSSRSFCENGRAHGYGGQMVQATAWGLVIVTASLEGEIRVYQNFGMPLKVSRQTHLF